MKKILITLSLAFILISTQLFGIQTKGYVVNGTITGMKETYVLFAHVVNGNQKIDTIAVKDGSFIIKGNVTEPSVVMLFNPAARLQRLFFLDNSEIEIKGNVEDLSQITVTGSAGQLEYERLQQDIQNNRGRVIEASEKMDEAAKAGDSISKKQYKILSDSLYKYEKVIIMRHIRENPNSYLSANQLFYNLDENNFDECKKLYDAFSPTIKQSGIGKDVATRFATLGNVRIGQPAQNFVQKDTLGNPVSLSTYKGKYVLLEFWASWCGPCRAEGPNLLKAYEQYKDKGLIILAVSLDKEMGLWKKAIKDDHLPWIHVSDLKYWKNEVAEQYGVHAVPANFLISPEGKIVAKNLRGDLLWTGLAKFIK